MLIVHTIADLRAALGSSHKPAFVATMGNLHQGHLDLVQRARALGDMTVASIFVNRLQFAPHEDFDSYPRTLADDAAQLEATGCQVLFAPAEAQLYPQPQTFRVLPGPALADILEGHFRPGFFTGVCTVVMKLFQAVFAGKAAGVALFGMKDYQQQLVIRQMVRQFALPIDIVSAPTQRASDGLALSSRNGYLSAQQRSEAVALSRALQQLAGAAGQAQASALPGLEARALQDLDARGWRSDYLTVRRRSDLLAPEGALAGQELVALGAARLGTTRLIDNLEF
ncbi:MAG: pantoate--beta-alanine ligase [Betaproteobacteria bacterium]